MRFTSGQSDSPTVEPARKTARGSTAAREPAGTSTGLFVKGPQPAGIHYPLTRSPAQQWCPDPASVGARPLPPAMHLKYCQIVWQCCTPSGALLPKGSAPDVALRFGGAEAGARGRGPRARRELLNQRLCAQHPHIVHLREAFLTPGHLGIAMEFASSGDLLDYVEAHVAHVNPTAQYPSWVGLELSHLCCLL